ncbi:MAG: hypothetical protein IJB79_08175 [Candidatus Gastranaerophilales bacterium]|nr:hypothetical protein [Candidatus Gastranaerophilales bacterium]
MTPFPEAEIMTIKRLEVALRKMDFKLLKDGAYKLHEKYHSGHKFEYLDLLKEIYIEISNNPSVPSDVKDILSPTIEDILAQGGVQADTATSPYESLNQQDVSISLNQNVQEPIKEETKINAFDAFSPQKPVAPAPVKYFTQSPFSAEPFKDFNTPKDEPQMVEFEQSNQQEEINEAQEQAYQEVAKETIDDFVNQQESVQENIQEEIQEASQEENFVAQEVFEEEKNEERKSVAIFYGQDVSNEKAKNILKLREIIANSRDKESLIDDLFALISEISTQADTNINELHGVLEQLKNRGNNTNLITNSQSAMFSELLDALSVPYGLYEKNEDNKINIIPLYGLSNLFVCEECEEKYLDKSQGAKPLVLECPNCKNPMYPDLYATGEKALLNIEYYNKALVNLANSQVWLLIHPSYADKTSSKLIESALKVSSNVKEIYVLDKDINIREHYKNIISKVKPQVKVNTQNNALEDFFNNI